MRQSCLFTILSYIRNRTSSAIFCSLAVLVLNTGCVTSSVYQEFKDAELRSVSIKLKEITPGKVKMVVGTKYRGAPARKRNFKFDPGLEGCALIQVIAKTKRGSGPLSAGVRYPLDLRAKQERSPAGSTKPGPAHEIVADCTIAIHPSMFKNDVWIGARNHEQLLQHVIIPPRKNVMFLAAVLPATLLVDVASVPFFMFAACLNDPSCVRSILEGLETGC